jgi:hypothetical protein
VKVGRRRGIGPAQDKLTEAGIDAICERIADCVALHRIADEFGVSKATLLTWLGQYPDHYARAKEAQADKFAEEIIAIADEEKTTIRGGDDDGPVEVVFDSTAVQRNRLRVDARKWLASKMAPKKYGDRIQQEHSGRVTLTPADFSDDELASIAAGRQA